VEPAAVRLITPDLALLDAALAGPDVVGRALGCAVAEGWEVFPGALAHVRAARAENPGDGRWGARFFVLDQPPTLAGFGGFKGPPRDGVVEVGYAVAPELQGRGIAGAALDAMLREAFDDPAIAAVDAETLPERNASVRVLERAGFTRNGEGSDEDVGATWRWRLQRASADVS
jgi:RimJ/RimL family protein N-acetyltransferase